MILASEATYKCEVSADSPSFATISAERQMKVYGKCLAEVDCCRKRHKTMPDRTLTPVCPRAAHSFVLATVLPKQKLAIVDNGQPSYAPGAGHEQKPGAGKQTGSLVYNWNDQINVTCLAGPSRPAAQLTWLLNESPISASSRWLTSHVQPLASHTKPSWARHHEHKYDLIESRLTLTLKLQPNVLFRQPNASTLDLQRHAGLHPINLRCIAKLIVEFTSETSILVSGGKTTIKRRQQQQQPLGAPLPSASLLVESASQTANESPVAQDKHSQPDNWNQFPMYRWPRPQRATAHQDRQRHSLAADALAEPWPIQAPGAVEPEPQQQQQQQQVTRASHQQAGRQVVVWTQRQLRAQAEHIEQMLRKSHPNQLEPPIIEARTQLEDAGGQEEKEGEEEEEEATGDRFESDSEPPDSRVRPGWTKRDRWPSSAVRDYELDELVQFTCTAQVGQAEQELMRSVHLKWFINDHEVSWDTNKLSELAIWLNTSG